MWSGAVCEDWRLKPQLPPQLSTGSLAPIRHWETGDRTLGRRREAMIREPGNLPFNRAKAGGVPWPIIDAGAACPPPAKEPPPFGSPIQAPVIGQGPGACS